MKKPTSKQIETIDRALSQPTVLTDEQAKRILANIAKATPKNTMQKIYRSSEQEARLQGVATARLCQEAREAME
ncbi:MAG: hypothetical protein WC356_02135 [Candidatus Micrarchaeia archaeon]|jgi:hypothetical protein